MSSPQAPLPSPLPPPSESVANLELKARLLLLFMLALVLGSALYVLYARGAFESTQRLVLLADDSEGVVVRQPEHSPEDAPSFGSQQQQQQQFAMPTGSALSTGSALATGSAVRMGAAAPAGAAVPAAPRSRQQQSDRVRPAATGGDAR